MAKTYHHETYETLKGEFIVKHEEIIIDTPKGLKIKYYHVDKDGKEKVTIFRNKDGTFAFKIQSGGKEDQKTLSKDELVNEVKESKHLKFVLDFLKTQAGGEWSMARAKKSSGKKRSTTKKTMGQTKKSTGKRKKTTGKKSTGSKKTKGV